MTPTELRQHMRALGLSQGGLARLLRLGIKDDHRQNARNIRRWLAGQNEIPIAAQIILEAYMNNGGDLPGMAVTADRLNGPVQVILESYADHDGVLPDLDGFKRLPTHPHTA